jgi:hypothetical protein
VLKRTGGGTILMLDDSIKCKNVHAATSVSLSDFQNIRILTHRNISCRASELAQFFRTMNFMQQPVLRAALVTNARSMHAYYIVVGPSKNSHFAISGAILY